MKNWFRKVCPPYLWKLGQRVRAEWLSRFGSVSVADAEKAKLNYLRINRGLPEDMICVRPGVTLKMHPESRHAFEQFCYAASPMVAELDAFIDMTQSHQRLLDIGALHGIFSLVFAASDSRRQVLAVDASPLAFAKLTFNIRANAFSNIEALHAAVTDAPGKLPMHYEWEHAVAAGAPGNGDNFFVDADSGDNICELRNFWPDVIKIDVEGHELKVLRGLRSTLDRCRPVVFLEVHPGRVAEEGCSLDELEQLCASHDYKPIKVGGGELVGRWSSEICDDERLVLLPRKSFFQ